MANKESKRKKYLTAVFDNKRYLSFTYGDGDVIANEKGNPVFAGDYWKVISKIRDISKDNEVSATVEYWTRNGIEEFTVSAAQLLDSRTVNQVLYKYGINCLACEAWQCAGWAQVCLDNAPEYLKYNFLGWREYKGQLCYFSWKVYQGGAEK